MKIKVERIIEVPEGEYCLHTEIPGYKECPHLIYYGGYGCHIYFRMATEVHDDYGKLYSVLKCDECYNAEVINEP